uniref:ORF45 n=1 Tax=Nitrosopumilaceae spindle-shaped virus TaxID=3065433 RepID=A0AAT9J9V0_9VIRU
MNFMSTEEINKRIIDIETQLEKIKIQYDDDILAYYQNPKYKKLDLEQISLRGILHLKEAPKDSTIHVVRKSPTQFSAFFIQNETLQKVWIPSIMVRHKQEAFVFSRSGGGYSKSHDIAYSLGLLVQNDGYWFNHQEL